MFSLEETMGRHIFACTASLLLAGCVTASAPSASPSFATFIDPHAVAVEPGICNCDDDVLYVADYVSVRMIQGSTVTTLAGPTDASSGGLCPAGFVDGTGTAARFEYITAIVRDPNTGNLYVTEHTNNAIRKITPAGVVTTFAGQGPVGSTPMTPSVDGIGTAATFSHPSGITIDPTGTYLYVTDSYDYSVRRIEIATQAVRTVIGGQYLFPMVPSAVRLSNPAGIWFQPGSPNLLYVVDQGYGRIRFFDPALYVPGTPLSPAVMGIMPAITFILSHPTGIALDPGNNIYLTEGGTLRRGAVGTVYPVVAGSVAGDSNSVPIGVNAQFSTLTGIALSPHGVLYMVDQGNNRIRRMGISGSYPVDVRAGHEPGNPQGCRDGAA
jgi:DNA-binding beta-propeller fold protein YncE